MGFSHVVWNTDTSKAKKHLYCLHLGYIKTEKISEVLRDCPEITPPISSIENTFQAQFSILLRETI